MVIHLSPDLGDGFSAIAMGNTDRCLLREAAEARRESSEASPGNFHSTHLQHHSNLTGQSSHDRKRLVEAGQKYIVCCILKFPDCGRQGRVGSAENLDVAVSVRSEVRAALSCLLCTEYP